MIPDRPNVDEFISIINDLADVQDDLNRQEYEYKKTVAGYKKTAMQAGKKTREVEIVEYLGNTPEEEKVLDEMMLKILDRRKAVRILWGKVEAWKANKDLFRSDSYHIVTGRGVLGGFSDAEVK